MNRGVPPTPLKARTGLFTPPGIDRRARAMSAPCRPGLDSSAECLVGERPVDVMTINLFEA
jgi:hypothetical protein